MTKKITNLYNTVKKTLLIATLLLASIKGYSQKADSIVYREVRVYKAAATNYSYLVSELDKNGDSKIIDQGECSYSILGSIKKSCEDGWRLITIDNRDGYMYLYLEKIYKRK